MSAENQLGKTYSFILKRMVKTGQAPFYTEIAAELGVSVEEGRKRLRGSLANRIAFRFAPELTMPAPAAIAATRSMAASI
jgi:hypothetical protein